ncbi:MAG TPA: hypothetical protein VG426_10030 [Candidatus Dormibacteraeota bacterium]|jgi:hypothetical protein|nr:hypothetical protein [Candidatus Dormibacteraeota bacterium]
MQAPGIDAPPAAAFVRVAPVVVDASEAITSEHASTLAILAAWVGLGLGLFSDVELEVDGDDPHAASRRPASITAVDTTPIRIPPITR